VKLEELFAARGVALERLDLRRPSLEELSFAAMEAEVVRALDAAEGTAVVFGSSLGGLTAARVAERDARITRLVLLAPAFQLAARWRARMGEAAWAAWTAPGGQLPIDDYAERGRRTTVHGAFARELEARDAADGGWPVVRVPTLILHGRADDTVDISVSREFARRTPTARLVELDDGHELTASVDRIFAESCAFLGV
jgi:hypothetical protein